MPAPLKVLFVTSECSPFAKTGGLGDVVGALPKALQLRGLDVRIVMPLYAGMRWQDFEPLEGVLTVPMWYGAAYSGIRLTPLPGSDVPVYFLEHHHYFDRPHLYGPATGSYGDNLERFTFLSRGALELTKALGWIPDVVHAHDWPAALAPIYLNTVEWGQPLHGSASVYTVHNLAYQGVFDGGALFITGLGPEHYHPHELEHFGTMNLTKGAIYHATLLGTVSPTYAREIQTPEYGCGLDGPLAERSSDLVGILNGIDVSQWDPATDPTIRERFDSTSLDGKAACKAALQTEAGLPVRPGRPSSHSSGVSPRRRGSTCWRRRSIACSRGTSSWCCSARATRTRSISLPRPPVATPIASAPGSASTTRAPTASRRARISS